MKNSTFVDYEIMSNVFDGMMQIAIPKIGLAGELADAHWYYLPEEPTTLIVKYNDVQESYQDFPETFLAALEQSGTLHFIDIDNNRVITIPKKITFLS